MLVIKHRERTRSELTYEKLVDNSVMNYLTIEETPDILASGDKGLVLIDWYGTLTLCDT